MENKYTLPAHFAKKWVEALRSGKYKQGQEMLMRYNEGGYCCLGLACEIAGIKIESGYAYSFPFDLLKKKEISIDSLPAILQEDCFGTYKADLSVEEQVNFNCKLAKLNDTGHTFQQIADWIEANVHFEPVNLTAPATQSKIESAYNKQEKK